jgi:TolA-binding protein
MMFRNAARVIMVLAVTTAMAQTPSPAPTVPGGTDLMGRGLAGRRMPSQAAKRLSGMQTPDQLRQRMEDLENTLNQMHVVLKEMQAKAAKSSVKDSLAKTNLDMWELMVGHLDKELRELRVAVTAHEELEARRTALYKQADAKAEVETRFAARTPTPVPAGPGAGQSPAGQTALGQPAPTPPANNSPSPK